MRGWALIVLSTLLVLAPVHASHVTNPPVVSSCTIPAASSSGVNLQTGIVYGTMDGQAQRLDIAYPQSGSNHPMAVIIHGGGWNSGSRNDPSHRDTILRLAQDGFVAASIDYRLAPANKFPAAVEDARCAVRWMKANAGTYGGDASQVIAMGGSAGGQIAGMLHAAPNENWLDETGDCSYSGSPSVIGAALYFGATDLRDAALSGSSAPRSLIIDYLGADPAVNPALAASASPITYLDSSDGPVYLSHRAADPTVPIQQSRDYAAAAHAVNVPATLIELSSAGHGFEWFDTTSAFQTSSCTGLSFLQFATSTGAPTCNCGGWQSGTCGGGSCGSGEREQTRSCTPGACLAETQCVADAACNPPPSGSGLLFHSTLDSFAAIQNPIVGSGSGAQQSSVQYVSTPWGNGVQMNAASDYLRIPQIDNGVKNIELDTGTVTFKFQPQYNHLDAVKTNIFSSSTWDTVGGFGFGKQTVVNNNGLYLMHFNGALPGHDETFVDSPDYSWNAGDWVDVRITWDWTSSGQNVHIYLDGTEVVQTISPSGPKPLGVESTSDYIWLLGRELNSNFASNAIIDEIMIWDSVIPPSNPPVCIPSTEVCNGVDDDCDTFVDEGDVCAPVCTPTTEVCDGQDNDCDGQVDEGGVCTPAPVPEDMNSDGNVDLLDLVVVVNNFGDTSGTYDLNNDGMVDLLDLILVVLAFT